MRLGAAQIQMLFRISTGTTLRAVVSAQGYLQSTSSATFTFLTQTPAPAFTPAPGSYTNAQVVTISDSVAGAVIYYTIDGSTPTVSSTVYNGPIAVNGSETVLAMATSNLTPSIVSGGTYTIQNSGTGIDFGSGFASVAGLTLNGSAINSDDSRLQLTSGGTFQAGSVFYNTVMNIQSFTNDFSFQLSNALADGFTFTIQSNAPTARGASGGSLGYAPIANSIAVKFDLANNSGEGTDSTGLYTGGALPTIPAIDMSSSGINLHSGDSMNVHMTYDGTTLSMTITDAVTGAQSFTVNIPQAVGGNTAYIGFTGGTGSTSASQKILTWTFLSNAPVATQTPVISPNGGSFTTAQTVTLTDATPGAVIYYTTDTSTPTTSSPVYSQPVTISNGSVTISALAVAPGYSPSPVVSATITIAKSAANPPSFTPSAGTYINAQTVSIADTTSGATIYYTTDNSTPSTSSAVYTSPINVAVSTTIKAIAEAPGFSASSVSSATYIFQATGQSIDFGSGFTSNSGLALNGSAQIDPVIGALQLTDGHTFEASSAWATTAVNITCIHIRLHFSDEESGRRWIYLCSSK